MRSIERSSELIVVKPVAKHVEQQVLHANEESLGSKVDLSSSGSGAKAYRYDRKDKSQLQFLLDAFKKDQVWNYADKVALAQATGMTYHKVSKWNWDHRKKLGLDTKRRNVKAEAKKQQ